MNMNNNDWDNTETPKNWLRDIMESDPETLKRRKNVKPMSKDMQDLFEYLDDPYRKSYPNKTKEKKK